MSIWHLMTFHIHAGVKFRQLFVKTQMTATNNLMHLIIMISQDFKLYELWNWQSSNMKVLVKFDGCDLGWTLSIELPLRFSALPGLCVELSNHVCIDTFSCMYIWTLYRFSANLWQMHYAWRTMTNTVRLSSLSRWWTTPLILWT